MNVGTKNHLINDIVNIIELFYKNKKIVTFVDVFGGSGDVLLNLPGNWKINRVYNDNIDHRLFILLNSLRDDKKRKILFEKTNIYNNFKYIMDWRIENLDYKDLIPKYDGGKTFFYLDPQYLKEGKFDINDFIVLKNVLKNIKGYWLMNKSDNNFKEIKEIFGEPKLVKNIIMIILID